jgi:uncharacterized protein YkwD
MKPSAARLRLLCAATAAVLALPCGAAVQEPPSGDGFARHLAEKINAYRQRNGLPPLLFTNDLAMLADAHSASMAAQHRLSHEGFRARFRRTTSRVCVENVAFDFLTPDLLLEGWRQSPAHRVNLLDPTVSRMGIAVSRRYVTYFACQ